MPKNSKGMKTVSMEIPLELNLSGSDLLYLSYHLVKAFSLNGDEFNKYLDTAVQPKTKVKIDEMYDSFLKGLEKLDHRYKQILEKGVKDNANST
jgi:hypothetical protein